MIWAIYRIHYGTDFIIKSVNSIIDNVDKIYIFYSEEPWVKTDKINYKNQLIEFPENPENLKKFLLKNFQNNKIIMRKYECNTPLNQYGDLYKIVENEEKKRAKFVLFMEPDMIFGKNQLKILKLELTLKFWLKNITTKQIETWKFNKDNINNFRIPLRKRRAGPVLWHINRNKKIQTEFSGCAIDKKKKFSNFVKILNMGFSLNKESMRYKHLLAIASATVIGDSKTDEMWYENKWLNWNPDTLNLDVSEGNQKKIKRAYKFKIPQKYNVYLK
tara:strand:+ start:6413 stop:7234 length:822 start_codon:yes stop_codon:yes gene_type:complete